MATLGSACVHTVCVCVAETEGDYVLESVHI